MEQPGLQSQLRTFPATAGLLALIVAVFLMEVALGGSTDAEVLLRLGAKFTPWVIVENQWWRLVTSTVLHIGPMHLAMNGWALWQLGRLSEITFGSATTLALFVFTGIAGSALSLLSLSISAGASGALFGIEGALVAFFLRHRDRLTVAGRALLKQLLVWSAAMFVFSFMMPGIDWLGHTGGFLGGIAVGWALKSRYEQRSETLSRMLVAICVVILFISIGFAWFTPPLPFPFT